MRSAPASLSPFNCITIHLTLYQIFSRFRGAKCDMRCAEPTLLYTNEAAKGYREFYRTVTLREAVKR